MTKEEPIIKIFISSHKPADTIDNPLFVPIQAGSALPGRKPIPGFQSDATGDHISEKNPRFCELTAQYWAWKNAEADYFGFFHYRRYLAFNHDHDAHTDVWGSIIEPSLTDDLPEKYGLTESVMREIIPQYDLILPESKDVTSMPGNTRTLREQYSAGPLHARDLDIMCEVLNEKYPEYTPYANAYLNGKMTHLNNMFIMSRPLFEEYSEWLFDILFECDGRIDNDDYSTEALRTPGHLAERLLNIYVAYLKDKRPELRIANYATVVPVDTTPIEHPKPAFKKDNVAIALSANDFYSPYLATALTSIREHSSADHNYDIMVMHKDISPDNQRRMQSILSEHKNFSLRFINIARLEPKFKKLFLRGHFTIETWFRLLMPELMEEYDKVLYLDSDLVVCADVAELYETDIKDHLLAACHDADTAGLYNGAEPGKKNYIDNILKLREPYEYFQAGVVLFNLAEFRKNYPTSELLEYAASYDWELLDQDVLNHFAEGRVKFVDTAWNVMYDWRFYRIPEQVALAPKRLQDDYLKAHANPKIIHYAGPDKPWDDPGVDYGEKFWHYARLSGYAEQIIYRALRCGAPRPASRTKELIKRIAVKALPSDTGRGRFARRTFARIRH